MPLSNTPTIFGCRIGCDILAARECPSPTTSRTSQELDLVESKREFIETFFKRGHEFTEELMRENEKLRFRVVQLEEERALDRQRQSRRRQAERRGAARAGRPHRGAGGRAREPACRASPASSGRTRDFNDRYHDIERENNNLANLYVASFQLHSTLDLREVTQIILEILLNFVGAKTFAIQLVDEEQQLLRRWRPRASTAPRCRRAASTTGASARCWLRGSRIIDGERLRARADLERPLIIVPLKIRDKVVGVVVIWDLLSQKTALADVDYELFNLSAAHAASSLQGAWLAAELKGKKPQLWAAADLV